MTTFLEDPECRRVVIYFDGKDLKASTPPPEKLKSKTVFAFKLESVKVESVNETVRPQPSLRCSNSS